MQLYLIEILANNSKGLVLKEMSFVDRLVINSLVKDILSKAVTKKNPCMYAIRNNPEFNALMEK